MNDLLEAMELEVRIAAAKSVREHIQHVTEEIPSAGSEEPEARRLEALTDALIELRTRQIERMWPAARSEKGAG